MALTRTIKVAAFGMMLVLLAPGVNVSAYRQQTPAGAEVPPEPPPVAARKNGELPKKEIAAAEANYQKELTLTSRVVDHAGKPLAGAEVTVWAVRGEMRSGGPGGVPLATRRLLTESKPLAQGQTNQEGRFRLTSPRAKLTKYSQLYALAGKTGYGLTIEPIALEAPPSETVLRLPPETIVRGRILDLQGQPAAGVKVRVMLGLGAYESKPKITFDYLSSNNVSFWPGPATTDKEGKFVLKGLSARQRVFLLMEGDRFMPQDKEIKFAGPGQVTEVNLALTAGQVLEGVVTAADTGKPLPHVKLLLRGGKYAFLQPDTTLGETDSEGHYRLTARPSLVDKLPAKEFTISANPGNGPYLRFVTTFPWPQAAVQHTLNIALPRGVLVRGKVTEEGTGKPVAGALVSDHDPKWPPRSIKTGPNGIFESVVPPGRAHFLVHHTNGNYIPVQVTEGELGGRKPSGGRYYPAALISFDAKAGTSAQEVEAKLRPGVTISGQLLRPDGKAVAEAVMLCWNQDSKGTPSRGPTVQVRGGRFELRRCDPNETYSVYFLDAQNQLGASARLSAKEAGGGPVTVRLAPCGKAVARVVKKNGEPVVGFPPMLSIVARPEEGKVEADTILLQAMDRVNYRGFLESDKQGRCTFPALIPGATYRIKALGLKSVPSFVVNPGETLVLPDIFIDRPG
jgi:protocatechuate 3,4-dioxygenase beta subunit